ncbi:transmembrane protein, putative [Medicago truncatula]|uniref:Transmembrane protein, putative n=1 Tax=Medicago truncatula TaxID=3880 RepID=A0A072V722_MEDTR|nr:transmembrane protein, putative [Medicago truncatula]
MTNMRPQGTFRSTTKTHRHRTGSRYRFTGAFSTTVAIQLFSTYISFGARRRDRSLNRHGPTILYHTRSSTVTVNSYRSYLRRNGQNSHKSDHASFLHLSRIVFDDPNPPKPIPDHAFGKG